MAPGGTPANFILGVHKVSEVKGTDAENKSKTYTIECVSQEAFHAKTNYIQKSYSQQISDMIKDIHNNYLHSTKDIITEDTKGPQVIVFPSVNPYKAVDMARRRAVSINNKSSSYLYFETRNPSDQVFKFVTLESLFRQTVTKTFRQSDAVGSNLYDTTDDNIIHTEIPEQLSAMDNIKTGGNTRIAKYNFRTRKYEYNDVDSPATSYATGGNNSWVTAEFKQLYTAKAKIPPQSHMPVDTSQRPLTNIPESTSDQQSFLAAMMQNSLYIEVPGDSQLTAGNLITCNIPQKIAISADKPNDLMMSGNFVISRIHHYIGGAAEKPRYTCAIEGLKGNY